MFRSHHYIHEMCGTYDQLDVIKASIVDMLTWNKIFIVDIDIMCYRKERDV